MPELLLSGPAGHSVFELGPYEALGRGRTNTIVVDHPSIDLDHAFFERRGGKTWLFDLGSSRGTYVGRDRNRGEAVELVDGDELQWGDVRAVYREELADWGDLFVSDEEAERSLAAAVRAAPDDEGPRVVFGDWLEARGYAARAAYVRRGPGSFDGRADPAVGIDNAFVAVFDRSHIEACPRGASCAPARWDRLRAAGGVRRRCDACASEVAYCCSEAELQKHRLLRRPVVVGAMVRRGVPAPYRASARPAEPPAWDGGGASLIVVAGSARRLYPLMKEVVLGRSPSSDLVLGVASSRHHMRVFERDGAHWLEDLQSTGGTYLNHAQIRGPTMLRHGDELWANVGDRFVYRASMSARLAPP